MPFTIVHVVIDDLALLFLYFSRYNNVE